MGALLQKLLLRVLPDSGSAERQHVTAALACCNTVRFDEREEENAHYDKEHSSSSSSSSSSSKEDDSSDLG